MRAISTIRDTQTSAKPASVITGLQHRMPFSGRPYGDIAYLEGDRPVLEDDQMAARENLITYRVVATHGDNPQPTFMWAAWRVLDAADRMQQLEQIAEDSASRWGAHVHVRAHADDPEGPLTLDFPGLRTELEQLGRPATSLASEVIHHARAALDYCAHNAAWMDSGVRNQHTQFPLEETAAGWKKSGLKGRWLEGVSSEHKQWIEAVQPYQGVGWAAQLKRLSNHDKHRVTIQVLPAYTVSIDRDQPTLDPLGDPKYVGFRDIERTVGMLIGDAFKIEEPVEAGPLLWGIIKGVTGIVNRFLTVEGLEPISIHEQPRNP